jgi:hypothetical protein
MAEKCPQLGNCPWTGFGCNFVLMKLGPWLNIEVPDMIKKGRIKKIE